MVPSSPMCGNIPIGSMWSKILAIGSQMRFFARNWTLYDCADMELAMFENHKLDWAGSPFPPSQPTRFNPSKASNKLQSVPLLRPTFSASTHRSGFRIRKTLSKSSFSKKLSHLLLTGSHYEAHLARGAYESFGFSSSWYGAQRQRVFPRCELNQSRTFLMDCPSRSRSHFKRRSSRSPSFTMDQIGAVLSRKLFSNNWKGALHIPVQLESVWAENLYATGSKRNTSCAAPGRLTSMTRNFLKC